jgi:3-oxoacyl-[acyl-carrier protein] reductase
MRLDGKNAIVTGGNRGIGYAAVEALAKAGANVVLLGRSELANQKAKLALEKAVPGAVIKVASLDVKDSLAIHDFVEQLQDEWRHIDILVNNAGNCRLSTPFEEIKQTDWQATFEVNLYGNVNFIQAVLPLMKKRKSGKIIQLASLAGEVGGIATAADYVASKAAIMGITKSLAREVGKYNINVNAVAPGFVRTDMTKEMTISLESIPLRRIAEPVDIANAILFLASEESRCITGTTLDVNCGLYMN